MSHAERVGNTETWEQKMAHEEMDEVVHYVKNQVLGFAIPYTLEGRERSTCRTSSCASGNGGEDLLNLIVEVSGERKKEKHRSR